MDLSLSKAARGELKNLLVCFSLANLCFLRRWYDLEHLKERAMDYYRRGPENPTLLAATVLDALVLTALFWLAWKWVERNPTPVRFTLARCGFLLICMYPLESVRLYWNQQETRPDLPSNIALVAIEAVLATGIVMAILGNGRIATAARRMALVLTLLIPALILDFGMSALNVEPASEYVNRPALPMLPPRPGPPRRVVWVLFDELDQKLVFDLREPKVALPQLDRLRAESVVANHATQTAGFTTQALPSLLSGVIFSVVKLEGANQLRVYPSDSRLGMEWHEAPNVFKKARAMGVNAALVGWHHPYCREIGDSLVRCMDVVSGFPTAALIRETAANTEGLWHTMGSLLYHELLGIREIFSSGGAPVTETVRDTFVQHWHQRQYFEIRGRAYADAADPRLDFVFLHFPIPHPYGIYDRKRGDFQLSSTLDYADNVALVDRTVGELRNALERAGLWDSTSLIITSDHGLRPDLWRGHMGWSAEYEELTGGKQSESVPLIVKLASQNQGAVYDRAFSNVVCGDLSLAILSGQVRTASDVAQWLDGRADKPE